MYLLTTPERSTLEHPVVMLDLRAKLAQPIALVRRQHQMLPAVGRLDFQRQISESLIRAPTASGKQVLQRDLTLGHRALVARAVDDFAYLSGRQLQLAREQGRPLGSRARQVLKLAPPRRLAHGNARGGKPHVLEGEALEQGVGVPRLGRHEERELAILGDVRGQPPRERLVAAVCLEERVQVFHEHRRLQQQALAQGEAQQQLRVLLAVQQRLEIEAKQLPLQRLAGFEHQFARVGPVRSIEIDHQTARRWILRELAPHERVQAAPDFGVHRNFVRDGAGRHQPHRVFETRVEDVQAQDEIQYGWVQAEETREVARARGARRIVDRLQEPGAQERAVIGQQRAGVPALRARGTKKLQHQPGARLLSRDVVVQIRKELVVLGVEFRRQARHDGLLLDRRQVKHVRELRQGQRHALLQAARDPRIESPAHRLGGGESGRLGCWPVADRSRALSDSRKVAIRCPMSTSSQRSSSSMCSTLSR